MIEKKLYMNAYGFKKFKGAELLWREAASKEFFRASFEEIVHAEMEFNRLFILRGHAYVNEFLAYFDVDPVPRIDNIGWNWEGYETYGYQWIDFSHWAINDGEFFEIDYPFPAHDIIYGNNIDIYYDTTSQKFQRLQ